MTKIKSSISIVLNTDVKPINSILKTIRERRLKVTLLGIGPMSLEVIYAALELGKELDFSLLFIASRNQVDSKEFGAGYVQGWDQKGFSQALDGWPGRWVSKVYFINAVTTAGPGRGTEKKMRNYR